MTTDKQVFFILAIDNAHGDDAKGPDEEESKVWSLSFARHVVRHVCSVFVLDCFHVGQGAVVFGGSVPVCRQ